MPESDSFDLVFSASLRPGFSVDQVRTNLQKLFKANDAQLDRMFSTEPVVLKSRLTEADAERYLEVLGKAGASCRLKIRPAQPVSEPGPAAPQKLAASSDRPAEQSGRNEEADGILAGINWDLAAAGSRLGDAREVPLAAIMSSVDFDLAPAGSDIGDRLEKKQPAPPDVSHIELSK